MYAVIVTGGKQYRVQAGQKLKLEKLPYEPGQAIEFDEVLMVAQGNDIKIGAPYVAGVKVTAKVIEQSRHKKIKIIKFRRRKHHDKQMGHRQYFTAVEITGISA